MLREVELRASLTYSPDDFRLTARMISEKSLDAGAFITHRYALDRARDAFSDIAEGMDHVKVILTVE